MKPFVLIASLLWSAIPQATFHPLPDKDEVPAYLNDGETIDNVFAAMPPRDRRHQSDPKGQRYISLFSSKSDADEFEGGKGNPMMRMLRQMTSKLSPSQQSEPIDGPACFTVVEHWHLQHHADNGFPLTFTATPNIHGYQRGTEAQKRYPDAGVRRVRMEALKAEGENPTLTVTDFWFDPSNMSMRGAGRTELPLARLAEGPGDVEVFAVRDAETVRFVVRLPRRRSARMASFVRNAQVRRGNDGGHSDCGHASVELSAVRGSGQTGWVEVSALLPVADDEQPEKPEMHGTEVRLRTLRINVGVSQTVADAAPLPTVSFGWEGRERRLQVF